jgi:hypothetical protein
MTTRIHHKANRGMFRIIGQNDRGTWLDREFSLETVAKRYADRRVRQSQQPIRMYVFDEHGNRLHAIGELGK